MATRARGDGSLFYDETDRLWIGRIDLGRDADGKRRRRTVKAKTKTEAARKLREVRTEAAGGLDVSGRAPTVAELAETWLTKYAPTTKAPSTLARTEPLVRKQIIPAVGHHRVDKLRPEHVEEWLARESRAGKAKATLEGYRLRLAEILTYGERRRLLTWNPARLATIPRDAKRPTPKRTLTEEQAETLLDVLADEREGPYFTTLLLLGLRPGEADALRWSSVDLDAGTLTIDAALQRGDGGRPLAIGPTKTKGTRQLAIPARVADALRRQRRRQREERLAAGAAWSAEWPDLVFTTEVGTPMYPSNRRREFDRICDRAGLPRLTPYELRHSAASLLVAAGVPPFEAADLLGHADLRMLERHYRHRLTPLVTVGPAAMDRMFGTSTR